MLYKKITYALVMLLLCNVISAQKLNGIIKDEKDSKLKFASIFIKELDLNVRSNENGLFSIPLKPGNYTVICSFVGFGKQEKKVTIDKIDVDIVFVMLPQSFQQEMATIRSDKEDYAYTVIRNAIKKREFYNNQVSAFQCDLYTKDLFKFRNIPKQFMGKKIDKNDKKDMGVDSNGKGVVYLSESVSKVNIQKPNKFKMDVISSRVSGSNGFGFTIPSFVNFNQNNVNVLSGSLNPRGFVSPIADGALRFYKYKYLGSFTEDGLEINTIQVTPKRAYEPLFSGIINIVEDKWFIYSLDLTLDKKSQLEILDTLNIKIENANIEKDIWKTKSQIIGLNIKQFGFDFLGSFVNFYDHYNIRPNFSSKFFDKTIIKYAKDVNKKDSIYWDSIRPMPLTIEEKKDYKVKDSAFKLQRDSSLSRARMDSSLKKQNIPTLRKIFLSGYQYQKIRSKKRFSVGMQPIIPNMEYNTAEGLVVNGIFNFSKYVKKLKSNLTLQPTLRYGFSNNHFNPNVFLELRSMRSKPDEKAKNNKLLFGLGQTVQQINIEEPITPLFNTISTLLQGNNFLKNQEKFFAGVQFSKNWESSLALKVLALYEDRTELQNTTDFVFIKKNATKLTPNNFSSNRFVGFANHQAALFQVSLSFKPGQKFIELPFSKIAVGSKYPTFSFTYSKGIANIIGSDVDFDKWKIGINDDLNLKLLGKLSYNVNIGGFVNRKKVFIQDFQHFNGNQFNLASQYLNSFQLASYYDNSTIENFYAQAHLEYHLNGLISNKIPLLKKYNIHFVVGTNTFYVNKNNSYIETFVGLENIFKVLRVDLVYGYSAIAKTTINGIRLGFGGLFGGFNSAGSSQRILKFN